MSPTALAGTRYFCWLMAQLGGSQLPFLVDSSYYTKTTEAMVIWPSLFEIIVGNLKGAYPTDKPNEEWFLQGAEMIHVVTTCGQAPKEAEPLHSLQVSRWMWLVEEMLWWQNRVKMTLRYQFEHARNDKPDYNALNG